ncbi:uncharacterized protein BCR38DRAFT_381082 [Pseudomassariella vexata]|uniref:Uncharacterized protein n=1 Tax=Pseudomassariella vexata TaxID=1141098 RepID=A0A1Y2EH96_9PEZI|nr:uncharacterized protein BCR38DRAFT_381082 [Pseudomassariella vexata]ORY70941.1 hypothetical protein BCR38DRAFT_381082 [Pseudomassariella vexata]
MLLPKFLHVALLLGIVAAQSSNEIDAAIEAWRFPDWSAWKFVNYCAGETLTNGKQVLEGSCNSIPHGNIPAKKNMISSILLSPKAGEQLPAETDFIIQVQTLNLAAGSFSDPATAYYAAPQDLKDGKVIGHTHFTVQDLGDNLNPQQPPDPTTFKFFKGINDEGDGNGLLQATVPGGLPAGNYRVCTLTAAANHQPVLMPVAQRGSSDDCTKFTVVANDKIDEDKGESSSRIRRKYIA